VYIVADIHPWVWFLTASPRLSQNAKSVLSDPSNLIIVPSIVMMEIRYLYQHKRITLSFEEALQQIEASENVLLYPLDISVATIAPITLDIHDAIIVGTTIHLAAELGQPVSLVTVDKAITDSNLVPVIW
jgi:PIN domain nuclease of toxin-antitoxin system